MITKNYRNVIAKILVPGKASPHFTVKALSNGTTWFASGSFDSNAFPNSRSESYVSSNSSGIMIGSGTTAPTEDDYKLESQHTSGLSVSINSSALLDEDNNPYTRFRMSITNTSSNDKVISEFGYAQTIRAFQSLSSTSTSQVLVLFDRTVLSTPITLEPGGLAVVDYVIKIVAVTSNGE